MTEKRYSHDGVVIKDHLKDLIYIEGRDDLLELAEYVKELQDDNKKIKEENQELNHFLKKEIDLKIEYKKRVKEILQEYFDKYTEMAMELRNDKYGNRICHDVTEVISEIADKLWIDLDLMGWKND